MLRKFLKELTADDVTANDSFTDPGGTTHTGSIGGGGGGGGSNDLSVTGRPTVSQGNTTIDVDAGGGGDYTSLQEALNQELPIILEHEYNFNVADGTYNEHVVLPEYMCGWVDRQTAGSRATAERTCVEIVGDRGTPSNCQLNSFSTAAGQGTVAVQGFEFTSHSGAGDIDNEDAHVSCYDTNKIDISDCESGSSATRFFNVYNSTVVVRNSLDVGNDNCTEVAKCKNNGQYIEGGGSTVNGSVTGNAYVPDHGYCAFDDSGTNNLSYGNKLVRQYSGPQNDAGWAFDKAEGDFWLSGEARGFVMRDQATAQPTVAYINNGSWAIDTV